MMSTPGRKALWSKVLPDWSPWRMFRPKPYETALMLAGGDVPTRGSSTRLGTPVIEVMLFVKKFSETLLLIRAPSFSVKLRALKDARHDAVPVPALHIFSWPTPA